jgi:hypothetical protein
MPKYTNAQKAATIIKTKLFVENTKDVNEKNTLTCKKRQTQKTST